MRQTGLRIGCPPAGASLVADNKVQRIYTSGKREPGGDASGFLFLLFPFILVGEGAGHVAASVGEGTSAEGGGCCWTDLPPPSLGDSDDTL